MYTNKRLTKAYKTAKREYFDKNSKYIFFSDCHRGDDSVSDEFARNQILLLHALKYYNENGYTYVEVGDGDEMWEYPDFKSIRLAHSDIFLEIKKFFDDNRLIMLYGNHNIFLRNKKFVEKTYYYYHDEYNRNTLELLTGIRPCEALVLKHRKTGQEVFVVHGHQGDLMNDQLWVISMLLLRYFWRYLHVVGFHNPASPARSQFKRHKVERTYKEWIRDHKKMLICGHTHRPRFPKKHTLPYFNSGCCIHSKGITGIEIMNDTIMMVDWRVRCDDKGSLHIKRYVIRGPEPLETFQM